MNILDAIRDPKVFGQHFRTDTWASWMVFLLALFALPMSPEQLAIYQKHTGRSAPPAAPATEAWLCTGRRGGKSFVLALIAVFLAAFVDWRPFLGPGEVGTIMIVAADRKQARVIMRYVVGLLKATPMLAKLIEAERAESIVLRNRIVIEIHTASFRTTRGYTVVAALLDEIAYWPTDESSSAPDVEVVAAIKPAMATVPNSMMLCASSPHARHGVLWEAHGKHYGQDGDPILVWQAPTRDMNPSVPQSLIDAAMEDDPARAAAEWLAQFRRDIEGFVDREAVRACVSAGMFERAPLRNLSYRAFVDPSGGSSDSMTLAIGHYEVDKQLIVIDLLREAKPPFSPEYVVGEFVSDLKRYGVMQIGGDRYAGEWPREQFRKFGITYEPSSKSKSELYVDLLPLINSRRVDLLDQQKCFNQLVGLERRSGRSGRDSIDHAPGAHDDLANALAGATNALLSRATYNLDILAGIERTDVEPIEVHRARRLDQYRRYMQPVTMNPTFVEN